MYTSLIQDSNRGVLKAKTIYLAPDDIHALEARAKFFKLYTAQGKPNLSLLIRACARDWLTIEMKREQRVNDHHLKLTVREWQFYAEFGEIPETVFRRHDLVF